MTRPARVALAVVASIVALSGAAMAHEVRPAYLELRELGAERFAMVWKVPAQGDLRFGVALALPARCARVGESDESWTGDAYVEHATLDCRGGLDGERIAISGLSATVIDVLVRVGRDDGSAQVVRLTPSSPAFTVVAAPGALGVAETYVDLGIEHILFGIDHLLFVLALLILVGATRRLFATVTAFTVAHSVTHAAATLGIVHVPQRAVEAVIALSIMFVAANILHGAEGRPGLTSRRPWLVAFTFGLLHGLGFAGALAEIGLPPQAIPLALVSFNLGVELGQLAFIAAMLGLGALAGRIRIAWPAWSWYLPPYAIGSVAAYWTIQRLAQF